MPRLKSSFLGREFCGGILLLAVTFSAPGCRRSSQRITETLPHEQPCVFLLLGFGDRAWSGGLDQIGAKLRQKGCFARVAPYRKWDDIMRDVVRDRPENLVLIGHSHGGVVAIKAAVRVLERERIPIRLLVLLDVGRPDPIPAIVDVAVHYYVVPRTTSFRSGPRSKLEPGNSHTRLKNIAVGPEGDVPSARDVDHLTICDSAAIHEMILTEIKAARLLPPENRTSFTSADSGK